MDSDFSKLGEGTTHLAEMEARFQAKVVLYEDRGVLKPGGMCDSCGGGPTLKPDWREEPWLIYKAGMCDSDGVAFGQLCEGCLEEIREENRNRTRTQRDLAAREVFELLGEDIDAFKTFMEDFGDLGEEI